MSVDAIRAFEESLRNSNSGTATYGPDRGNELYNDLYAAMRADPNRPPGDNRRSSINPPQPRPLRDPRFVVAVDLGQAHDHTAVIVLERKPGRAYEVPFVSRAPLGIAYPEMVRSILKIVTTAPVAGTCHLIVDQTGCGRAVVDLLRRGPVPVIGATVTSGERVTGGRLTYHVPKRDMIAAAQIALQDRRLQIAAEADHAAVLVKELQEFRVKISAAGHDSYGVWRENGNDDLAFALALAVWWADMLQARMDRLRPKPMQ